MSFSQIRGTMKKSAWDHPATPRRGYDVRFPKKARPPETLFLLPISERALDLLEPPGLPTDHRPPLRSLRPDPFLPFAGAARLLAGGHLPGLVQWTSAAFPRNPLADLAAGALSQGPLPPRPVRSGKRHLVDGLRRHRLLPAVQPGGHCSHVCIFQLKIPAPPHSREQEKTP